MGIVQINFDALLEAPMNEPRWFDVTPGFPPHLVCQNAKGQLLLAVQLLEINELQDLGRSDSLQLDCNKVQIDLSWETSSATHNIHGRECLDLDCSLVPIDWEGEIMVNDSIYYGNLSNFNNSLRHSGEQKSKSREHSTNESIIVEFDRLPRNILAMYVLLTVKAPTLTFDDVASAQLHLRDATESSSGVYQGYRGICRYFPSQVQGERLTCIFMIIISRATKTTQPRNDWAVGPIGNGNSDHRDCGSLMPHIVGYSRDLVPGIGITKIIDPFNRIAMMRKGETIRIQDYIPSEVRIADYIPAEMSLHSVLHGILRMVAPLT